MFSAQWTLRATSVFSFKEPSKTILFVMCYKRGEGEEEDRQNSTASAGLRSRT